MHVDGLRSPYEALDGLRYLPRLLDKIRLSASGRLPEDYHPLLGRGFDGRLCAALELDYQALRRTVLDNGLDDAAALAWIRVQGKWPNAELQFAFNEFLRKRGWQDDLTPQLSRLSEAAGLDDDGSLETSFDLIEADEERIPPDWPTFTGAPAPVSPLPAHMVERVRLFQRTARPLEPLPTPEAPLLPVLEGLRAVIFDIYGTLFISGTGDISLADNEDRGPLLRAALANAGIANIPTDIGLADRFHGAIRAAQEERRDEGVEFPEVEIREVWHRFLAELAVDGLTFDQPEGEALARLAMDYETRVNPVWPMPHLAPTLAALRERGLALGIVSNAQFYSRAMFPAFLGAPLGGLGFSLDCCVWSYREREGKPSTALYAKLRDALAARGIAPEEALYVGNDLRNDIWPAGQLGFRTALFAGDERSLRWRREDPALAGVRPEAILTDLWQILQLLPE
ncbi:MAG: DUF5069 domain-containing protein [Opitutales bacterium]